MQDPTDDIAADQALFPAVISAATLLSTDSSLVSQLRTAEGQIEPYPRTSQHPSPTAQPAAHVGGRGRECRRRGQRRDRRLLPAVGGHPQQENIGLEPVWPYGVIGDSTTVERRQPDRAGRPDLQLPAEYPNTRLDLRRGRRRPPGHGLPGLLRPGHQHREVPGLHLRPGRVQPQSDRRAVHRADLQRRHRPGRGAGHRLRRHAAVRPRLAVGLGRRRHRLHPGRIQGRRPDRGRHHRHRRHPGRHDRRP